MKIALSEIGSESRGYSMKIALSAIGSEGRCQNGGVGRQEAGDRRQEPGDRTEISGKPRCQVECTAFGGNTDREPGSLRVWFHEPVPPKSGTLAGTGMATTTARKGPALTERCFCRHNKPQASVRSVSTSH